MTTNRETWKPITGYQGIYEISDQGNVRSLPRTIRTAKGTTARIKGTPLKPVKMNTGYCQVTLWKNHHGSNRTIHTLVAETFLGAPQKGQEVCHNNGIKSDNRLTNLRYGTRSENALDRNRHGTNHLKNRTHCPRGHALKAPNLTRYSQKHGHRTCLACAKAHSYMHYHKIPKTELKRISDQYLKQILAGN